MTALHLARPEDLERLVTLSAACHAEMGIARDDDSRRAGLAPLLDGLPQGAVYLVGPTRAPLGYAVLSFGWSLAEAGIEARLEELFIRPAVCRRGIATEVLADLPKALGAAGVRALTLRLAPDAPSRALFERARFQPVAAEVMIKQL
ncbi:GNAT family N-acetyltransferase [Aquicoccus sp. SU-CL01552]|uniref:GNAT family N-acetyltransferase n=1 Tax=Aquicoccus sp. SU-CL01552 TaxID=3127656 RepID=UPI00310BB249